MKASGIAEAKEYARQKMDGDHTGHDWEHIQRVLNLSKFLHYAEKCGNLKEIELIALLHDVCDGKLTKAPCKCNQELRMFLAGLGLEEDRIQKIMDDIASISFRAGIKELSAEAAIVQDADRLDAIGAIGIARTFAYGAVKGSKMYDPEAGNRDKESTIAHFYEKLLQLKDQLNTETAKQMAEERHSFMEEFLDHFKKEWNG